ncbi:hypothetical protein SEA_ATUIN_276 [Arthrobacter phage Atuin]|nr:hypothetical protein SEA_ATUIN_75 [Arthrobacter phage Atuin]
MDIKRGTWVRIKDGAHKGKVGLVHLSFEHESNLMMAPKGDILICRNDNLETVSGIRFGDRVRVLLKTGVHAAQEGTVTEVNEDGTVAVDLDSDSEILFCGFDLEVFDPAPAGTSYVEFTLVGSEDDTKNSGRWTDTEVKTLLKLARELNRDRVSGLQPSCEVKVDGKKVEDV